MATIDLGKIKPVWKGNWAGSTAYEKNDMVSNGVNSYICTTAHTSSGTFSSDTANWDVIAYGAELPSQSGQSGKVLRTDGTTLSWAEDVGGAIVQVKSAVYTGMTSTSTTMGGLSLTMTPIYENSNFLFIANCFFGQSNHDISANIKLDISGAAPGGTISPLGATGNGDRVFSIGGVGASAGLGTSYSDWAIVQNSPHFLYVPPSNMGTSTRTFQIIAERVGNGGSIIWNRRWNGGTDSRAHTTPSTLTVMEVRA